MWAKLKDVPQQQAAKKLRGLSAHVQAQRTGISPSFSVAGVSLFLSPPRRGQDQQGLRAVQKESAEVCRFSLEP